MLLCGPALPEQGAKFIVLKHSCQNRGNQKDKGMFIINKSYFDNPGESCWLWFSLFRLTCLWWFKNVFYEYSWITRDTFWIREWIFLFAQEQTPLTRMYSTSYPLALNLACSSCKEKPEAKHNKDTLCTDVATSSNPACQTHQESHKVYTASTMASTLPEPHHNTETDGSLWRLCERLMGSWAHTSNLPTQSFTSQTMQTWWWD